ncbi:hypothetical protein IB241_15810 [Pseudomonas sp. PDM05]|uniref:hypothetical protein n=1 Tax=Pseudomonas sp. PDM05 TaxID=2769301 RepID=UPI00177EFE08|nr:hypothetical protein [Pseudomonas sp. PDM05]MBD9459148.1 hypothetical protein [Pseudomonas sp. PDM05]
MSIDWSKAPAWATAVGKHNISLAWICDSGYCFQGIYNPPCHPFKENSYSLKDFSVVERRPWPGNGLPPVGTVCEYLGAHQYNEWSEVKIFGSWRNFVFVDFTDGWRQEDNPKRFRPLRTPDQIAADERQRVVMAIGDILITSRGNSNEYHQAGLIYDAGYRKQPAP